MKYAKYIPSLCMLIAIFTTNPSAHAAEWRQGASVGGTHMVGYDLEMPLFNPLRLEVTLGIWELALTSSQTLKQYYETPGYNFFYGGGIWQIMELTQDEGGMINMIRAVIGFEWPLNRNTVWGAEAGVNYPYPDRDLSFWGKNQSIEFNRRMRFPFPRFYYRWTF